MILEVVRLCKIKQCRIKTSFIALRRSARSRAAAAIFFMEVAGGKCDFGKIVP